MTEGDAHVRLCSLTTLVMQKVFDNEEPADCFCGFRLTDQSLVISERIIKFIEDAVRLAITRDLEAKRANLVQALASTPDPMYDEYVKNFPNVDDPRR